MVIEPRKVLSEFGTHIPESTEIRIHDSTAECRYIVIPKRPKVGSMVNAVVAMLNSSLTVPRIIAAVFASDRDLME